MLGFGSAARKGATIVRRSGLADPMAIVQRVMKEHPTAGQEEVVRLTWDVVSDDHIACEAFVTYGAALLYGQLLDDERTTRKPAAELRPEPRPEPLLDLEEVNAGLRGEGIEPIHAPIRLEDIEPIKPAPSFADAVPPEVKQAERAAAKEKQMGRLMSMVTPLGKLGDLTGKQGRSLTSKFAACFKGVPDNKTLVETKTEADLEKIFNK